jgi:hypothetical protein
MEDWKHIAQEALNNIVAIEATISELEKNESFCQVIMFSLRKYSICEPLHYVKMHEVSISSLEC